MGLGMMGWVFFFFFFFSMDYYRIFRVGAEYLDSFFCSLVLFLLCLDFLALWSWELVFWVLLYVHSNQYNNA